MECLFLSKHLSIQDYHCILNRLSILHSFHFRFGTICLIILNIIINPEVFTIHFYNNQSFNYTWVVGGLLGVTFLTGNLLLLPKLGATLTVIATVAGQIIMGVIIDTFGLFGATIHDFNLIKAIGVLLLIVGIAP